MRLVINEKSFIVENETLEERNARHDRILSETGNEIGAVGGLIMVDPAVAEVRHAYARLWTSMDRCLLAWRAGQRGETATGSITALTTAVGEEADTVARLARAHLTQLDTPPELPSAPRWWQLWR